MDIKKVAYVYVALGILLGAMVPIMLKLASQMNLYEFLFLTYVISAAVSLTYVAARGKMSRLVSYIKDQKQFATIGAMGVINYAFMELGLAYAEKFVSVSLATVIYRTFPLLMLAFIPFILKERISKYQFVALLLGFFGLIIALSGGTLQLFSGISPQITVLLVSLAIAAAVGNLLVKRYSYDIDCGMAIFSIANLVVFFLLFAANGFPTSAINTSTLVSMFYVGIIYNIFGSIMFWTSLRILKATFVANLIFLSPFITFVYAYIILGQTIQIYYVIVAVLVTIGIFVQSIDKFGGAYKAVKKSIDNFTIFDVTGAFVNSGEMGIADSIDNGGRVLAAKIAPKHEKHMVEIINSNAYKNIFTDRQISLKESVFVKDILGASGEDIVVLKVGSGEEGERFFSDLSNKISYFDVKE